MTPEQSADLVRLKDAVEKWRNGPGRPKDVVYNDGYDDALCWVLDQIDVLIDGKVRS